MHPLHLNDEIVLTQKFKQLNLNISEYSFANLYLFRDIHQYKIVKNGDIYIKGVTRDQTRFLMPTTHIEQWNWSSLKDSIKTVDCLFPIPEQWLHHFDSNEFKWDYNENDDDYLLLTEKIHTYKGRHLDGKRYLARQFTEKYAPQVVELNNSHLQAAQSILIHWQQGLTDETDYSACNEALMLFNDLHLEGLIVYIDKQPCAFVIGEVLSSQTYIIHFIKANKSFKGAYEYLYQQVARRLKKEILFFNLEQDLGLPNLRKAKRSYQPAFMQHKWRVRFNH